MMAMVGKETGGSDSPVARRVRLLRQSFTGDNASKFAKDFAQCSPARWSNFECGYPLSKNIAFTLVKKIPGLSLDWLWHGERRGLTFDVLTRLDEMEAILERKGRTSQGDS
jgi:hypothetical protein